MQTSNQGNVIKLVSSEFKGSIFLKKSELDYLAKPSKYMTNYKRYKEQSYQTHIALRNKQKIYLQKFKKDNITFSPFLLQEKNLFNNIRRHSTTNQANLSYQNKIQSHKSNRPNKSRVQKIEDSLTQRKTEYLKTKNTNEQIGNYINKIKSSAFRRSIGNTHSDSLKNDQINKKKLQIIADLHKIKQKRQNSIQKVKQNSIETQVHQKRNQLLNPQQNKIQVCTGENNYKETFLQDQEQKQQSSSSQHSEQYYQIKRQVQNRLNKNKIQISVDFTQILAQIKKKREHYSNPQNKKLKFISQLMVNSRGFNASSSFSAKNSTSSLRKILKSQQKNDKKLQEKLIIQKIVCNLGLQDMDKQKQLRQQEIQLIKLKQFKQINETRLLNQIQNEDQKAINLSCQAFCSFHIREDQQQIIYRSYFKHKENQKRQIASLTKIMTCLLAIKICQKFSLNIKQEKVIVSKKAANMNGTSATLTYGDTVTVFQMLHGLMLPSGNDAAIAIAQWGGKRIRRFTNVINIYRLFPKNYKFQEKSDKKSYLKLFLYHMNKSAKILKLDRTHYSNCHGLMDSRANSTAQNICFLSMYAMQNQLFRQIVAKQNFKCRIFNRTFSQNRQVEWKNTHNMLKMTGFQGIKTGITTSAGPCLTSSFQVSNKQRIIVCILKASNMNGRFQQTYEVILQNLKKILQNSNLAYKYMINQKLQSLQREWCEYLLQKQQAKQMKKEREEETNQ